MKGLLSCAAVAAVVGMGGRGWAAPAEVVHPIQGKYSCRTPQPEDAVARIGQLEFGGSKLTMTPSSGDPSRTVDCVDNSFKLTSIEKKMGLVLIEGNADFKFSLKTLRTPAGQLLIETYDGFAEDRSEVYDRGEVKLSFDYICSPISN